METLTRLIFQAATFGSFCFFWCFISSTLCLSEKTDLPGLRQSSVRNIHSTGTKRPGLSLGFGTPPHRASPSLPWLAVWVWALGQHLTGFTIATLVGSFEGGSLESHASRAAVETLSKCNFCLTPLFHQSSSKLVLFHISRFHVMFHLVK